MICIQGVSKTFGRNLKAGREDINKQIKFRNIGSLEAVESTIEIDSRTPRAGLNHPSSYIFSEECIVTKFGRCRRACHMLG